MNTAKSNLITYKDLRGTVLEFFVFNKLRYYIVQNTIQYVIYKCKYVINLT